MKIRIITIHNIPNFGSVFQCYGLSKYLETIGHKDVKVIDYQPKYFEKFKSIKSFIGYLLNIKNYYRRKNKFRTFVKNNIPLTKKFTSCEDLQKYNFNADVYIAGGDQLWNVFHDCGNDDAFKLTFADNKKISYATSMGQNNFPKKDLELLSSKISDFSSISVRESVSVQELKSVGINAIHCVDPVFLLGVNEYKKFIKPVNQPKYILVYLVESSELLDKCIEHLARGKNLKVINCSGFSKKCYCDEIIKDLGPDEILSYIYNAEIVLSASFHATVFSIMFKKQFFTLLPNKHTNERILDLLNIYGLEEQIITEFDKDKLNSIINFDRVKDYSKKIEKSKKYLENALK